MLQLRYTVLPYGRPPLIGLFNNVWDHFWFDCELIRVPFRYGTLFFRRKFFFTASLCGRMNISTQYKYRDFRGKTLKWVSGQCPVHAQKSIIFRGKIFRKYFSGKSIHPFYCNLLFIFPRFFFISYVPLYFPPRCRLE